VLKNEEKRYKGFIHNFKGIAFQGDMNWQPIFFDGAVEEITGYTEKDFISSNLKWDEVIHPEDLSIIHKNGSIGKIHSIPNFSVELEYRIIRKDGDIRWVHEIIQNICDDSGKPILVQGVIYDITEKKHIEENIKFRLDFEKTISKVSSQFVGLSNIDDAINNTLKNIGIFSGASRAYLFLYNEGRTTMSNTHEWCANGVTPQINNLQNVPISMTPWWMKKIHNNEIIHIKDVSKLPDEAQSEKEILEKQDIKSLVVLPLHINNELSGFLGFDNVFKKGSWNKSDIELLRIISEILGSALARKKSEEEIFKTKEYLQNIIDNTSEIMMSLDENNKITLWNNTAEQTTGYKKRQVINKTLEELSDVFDQTQDLLGDIQNIRNGKKNIIDEIIIKTKKGSKKIIKPSYITKIEKNDDKTVDLLIFGKDIAHEQKSHKNLLKGNSYLISEKNNQIGLDVFTNLTKLDYKGLYITRRNPDSIKSIMLSENTQVELLNKNKINGYRNISSLNELEKKITDFTLKNKKSVVLLERLDYLIANFSFEEFMKTLYKINSIILKNNSILLIYLNPNLLDIKQTSFIGSEIQIFPGQRIDDVQIEDKLYDILHFIYKQNRLNSIVTFKKINKEFFIDKSTTAKRVKNLENERLISIEKQGRTKTVHIAQKGEELIHKRQNL
jgi:PAS domain S-box-containing protein